MKKNRVEKKGEDYFNVFGDIVIFHNKKRLKNKEGEARILSSDGNREMWRLE